MTVFATGYAHGANDSNSSAPNADANGELEYTLRGRNADDYRAGYRAGYADSEAGTRLTPMQIDDLSRAYYAHGE